MGIKTVYVCSNCGYEAVKWSGKCPECGSWNSMEEIERDISPVKTKTKTVYSKGKEWTTSEDGAVQVSEINSSDEMRYDTGIEELNRALGGGLVKGSVTLLGGDPGIGKSTLLLQMCGHLSSAMKILYISGEESKRQIKMRADRMDINCGNVYVATQTDIEKVCDLIGNIKPDTVMIDSIQTMYNSEISSAPGSITQVRECTQILTRLAKTMQIPMMIVGHVNKDGAIAGPKVMEHIVDTVLYFEGDRNLSYRILRAEKNRFGSTNEIGMFEMYDKGLREVSNPSSALLSERLENVSGSCVCSVIEGARPIFTEIQALVAKSGFTAPRRTVAGFDYNRAALLIAAIEKRAGYYFGNADVYINVVGGLRLDEPGVDLAVAIALVSGLVDTPVDAGTVAFGEIGLSGEIRAVSRASERVAEAVKLGFSKCIVPYGCLSYIQPELKDKIDICGVRTLSAALDIACQR